MPSYTAYKRQVMDADDNITWITMNGNHIPIKEGQTKEEAVKEFLASKGKSGEGSAKHGSGEYKAKETPAPAKPKKPASEHAQVAKLIKNELNKQGFKASARSSSFAGGDDVRVKVEGWYSDEIQDKIKGQFAKHQYGHFNGMEDIYEYSNINHDIPQTKYLFIDFDRPNDEDNATMRDFYLHKWSQKDIDEFNKMSEWEQNKEINQLLFRPEMLKEVKKWAKENNKPFSYIDTMPGTNEAQRLSGIEKPKTEKHKDLRSAFGKHYDKLYNDHDLDDKSGYLLDEWDKHIQDPKFKKAVQEFVEERGDFISSDREVKAFMLAAKETGLIPQEKKAKAKSKSDSPLVKAVAKALGKSESEAEKEIDGAAQYIKDLMKAKDLRNGDVEETLRGLGVEPDYAEEFLQWATYMKNN